MELIKPALITMPYDARKCVFIRDRYQQFLYIKHGAYPLDLYVALDTDDLVMVFDKQSTKELYEKYRRYELK